MKHFARVVRLVWPHRRFLIVTVLGMIGVALCLTASILSLYPILKVIIGKESIPDFVDRVCAQDRLGAEMFVQDTDRLTIKEYVGSRALRIVKLGEDQPLYRAGVRPFDYVTGVNGEVLHGREVIERLLTIPDGEPVRLSVWTPGTTESWQVTTTLKLVGSGPKLLRWITSKWKLPSGSEEVSPGEWMHQRMQILAVVLMVFFGLQLTGSICRIVGEYYGAVVGARTLMDLRRLMYARTLMLPVEFFQVEGVSGTMGRFVQDTQDVLRAMNTLFGKVLLEPMKMAGALGVALWLEPRLTLILMGISPIVILMFRQFGRRVRRANEKMLAGYGRLIEALKSTLLGIRVVKAYTMEHRERKRYFRWSVRF